AHAVISIVLGSTAGCVARHAKGHLPPEQGLTNALIHRPRPVEMLVEVRARLICLVPVPRAIVALAARVDVRFEAPGVAIERFQYEEIGVGGANSVEERNGLVDGAGPAGSMEADRHLRRPDASHLNQTLPHAG